MSELVETTEHNGIPIRIYRDSNPENPREWSNLGTMACIHRRYEIGDKHDYTAAQLDELVRQDHIVSLPIYLYDHGGITIRTTPFSCRWDSGQIGYIFVTHDRIKEEYGNTKPETIEKARRYLRHEVETMDQYLTGEVYGYRVGEDDDACCSRGYFGGDHEHTGLLANAREDAEEIIEKIRAREAVEAERMRNLVGASGAD